MRASGTVHQFLAENSFYKAVGEDDGCSEANAVRGAESCIAALKPALTVEVAEEIDRLLEHLGSGSPESKQIEAIVRSSERIIDVAETLGFPGLSRAARGLRLSCHNAAEGSIDRPDIAVHRETLRAIADTMTG